MRPDLAMKSMGMTVKALDGPADDPNGEFEAVLSTSDLDREGEQIMPGAFDPLPASIPVFKNHSWMTGANPIGEAVPRYEAGALKVLGRWAPTTEAQEIRTLVRGGFIKAMSAGFLTKLRDPRDPGKIVKAELIEASTASIPVNPKALFAMAKSLGVNLDPPGVNRRLVVKLKSGAPTAARDRAVDRELAEIRGRIASSAAAAGIDLRGAELENIGARIDQAVVDAGVDKRSTPAAQDQYLAAFGRVVRRQLLSLR